MDPLVIILAVIALAAGIVILFENIKAVTGWGIVALALIHLVPIIRGL